VQAFSLSPGSTRERGGRRRVVGGGVGHAMVVMMMMMLARRSYSSLPWTQKSQLQPSSNLDLLQRHCLNPKSPAAKPPPIAHHKHIDDLLLLLLLSSSSSNHSCEFNNNNNKKRKILKHQTGTPLSSSSSSTKHQISSQNQISISQSNFLLTSPNLHRRIITSNLKFFWWGGFKIQIQVC
jgi:hypothetical protein